MSVRLSITAPRTELWVERQQPFHYQLAQHALSRAITRHYDGDAPDAPIRSYPVPLRPEAKNELAALAGVGREKFDRWEKSLAEACRKQCGSSVAFVRLNDTRMGELADVVRSKLVKFGVLTAKEYAIDPTHLDLKVIQTRLRNAHEMGL